MGDYLEVNIFVTQNNTLPAYTKVNQAKLIFYFYFTTFPRIIVWEPFKCYVTQCPGDVSFPGKKRYEGYGSTLLALRGGGGGQISREKTFRIQEFFI